MSKKQPNTTNRESTHSAYVRRLKDLIQGYEKKINADLPNCSPEVQEILRRTAIKEEEEKE